VRRIVPILAVLLVASCGPLNNGSARKGQPAPQDEKYERALEYFTLTHLQGADANDPAGRPREKPSSTIDRQTAKRLLTLQEGIRAWRSEKPDARVAGKDEKEIDRIIDQLFEDPASRARMVVKTYDLKLCEGVKRQFYNKNRCFVGVLFYDRGPRMQAGLDLYLFKYKGRWEIVFRTDWIG
jgi:hypothetical protein